MYCHRDNKILCVLCRKTDEQSCLGDSSDSSVPADPPADPQADPPIDSWDGPPDYADSLSVDHHDPGNPRVNSPISIDSPRVSNYCIMLLKVL